MVGKFILGGFLFCFVFKENNTIVYLFIKISFIDQIGQLYNKKDGN